MTHTPVRAIRIVGDASEQMIGHLPVVGETRTYTVTATCKGHRTRDVGGESVMVVAEMAQTAVRELRTTVTDNEHSCGFDWCETTSEDNPEHWYGSRDVIATASTGASAPHVATGLSVVPGRLPSVYIHLHGGENDVDAYMTPSEALALLIELDIALVRAREAVVAQERGDAN